MALLIPSAASALTFEIDNQSQGANGPEDVYVTVVGAPGQFDVTGTINGVPSPLINDEPVLLSDIAGGKLTINVLVAGRIYVSYGAPVTNSVTFNSQTRFDWAELTVTPNSSDVANLTAVDQFGIGMRLDTYEDTSNPPLETVGAANSNTIFNALAQIPGGSNATVHDGAGNILRVLSPNQTDAYPELGDYVRSMSGQEVTLHTAFFGSPFTTSNYSGTFAADGSIELNGTTNPASAAPPTLSFAGSDLIADIYTGANTPNTLAGAIRRDVLAASARASGAGSTPTTRSPSAPTQSPTRREAGARTASTNPPSATLARASRPIRPASSTRP